jgi:hypothetical protein
LSGADGRHEGVVKLPWGYGQPPGLRQVGQAAEKPQVSEGPRRQEKTLRSLAGEGEKVTDEQQAGRRGHGLWPLMPGVRWSDPQSGALL